jgi:hypothetical protein
VVSKFGSSIYNFKTGVAFANENWLDVRRQRKKQWSVSPQASLATTFPRSHPVWFFVSFLQGSCFCTTTSSDAGWSAHAHHSSHLNDWPRHATKCLAVTWLPAWCVSCYEWSTYWTFVMYLKILNSSNTLLKSGTSFWLALYVSSYDYVLNSLVMLDIVLLYLRSPLWGGGGAILSQYQHPN